MSLDADGRCRVWMLNVGTRHWCCSSIVRLLNMSLITLEFSACHCFVQYPQSYAQRLLSYTQSAPVPDPDHSTDIRSNVGQSCFDVAGSGYGMLSEAGEVLQAGRNHSTRSKALIWKWVVPEMPNCPSRQCWSTLSAFRTISRLPSPSAFEQEPTRKL